MQAGVGRAALGVLAAVALAGCFSEPKEQEGGPETGHPDLAVSESGERAGRPLRLVLDADGRPLLAYGMIEPAPSGVLEPARYGVRMRAWGDARWTPLAGAELEGRFRAALARGPVLYAATEHQTEPDGPTEVRVHAWTGAAWAPVGPPVQASARWESAVWMALAVGHDGQPLLALTPLGPAEAPLRVVRWTGDTWEQQGAPPCVSRCSAPALAVGPDGVPLLAWSESGGGKRGHVARLVDGEWRLLGDGPLLGGASLHDVSLTVDAQGRVYAAASQLNGQPKVGRWEAGAWTWLDEGLPRAEVPGSGLTDAPGLALGPDGTPHVAFSMEHAAGWTHEVQRLGPDGRWQTLASLAPPQGASPTGPLWPPVLVVDAAGTVTLARATDETGVTSVRLEAPR